MPSPFPGMDPYLEKHWGDVHASLVTYARNQLQKVLPKDLRARVEERVVISGLGRPRSLYPDVRVIETQGKRRRPVRGAASVAVAEPVVIELPDEPETQTFVEIRDLSADSRVVTVLEVLGPSNKKPATHRSSTCVNSWNSCKPASASSSLTSCVRAIGSSQCRSMP